MSTFVPTAFDEPIKTMVREILNMAAPDARRLCEVQRQARKACLATLKTLKIEDPSQERHVRSLFHAAKVDVLLEEIREPGTLKSAGLAERVHQQFLLLLRGLQVSRFTTPDRPCSRELLPTR